MWQRWTRWLRHRWADDALRQLPPGLSDQLTAQIRQSECAHSGEIRVCIEAALPGSYLLQTASMKALVRQRAVDEFSRLRVWDTEHNNGVLLYLCLAERAIELVADRGIQHKVSDAHWAQLIGPLSERLRDGRWEAGLRTAIDRVSLTLQTHFPVASGQHNPNELTDKPSIQ
nr:TPM domain-containing protein [uncultured Rhodoferax sp.]